MTSQQLQPSQHRMVLATATLAAFPLGTVAIAHIMNDLRGGVIVVGLCTALLSALALHCVLRLVRSPAQAAGVGYAVITAAAILNAPVSFLLVSFFDNMNMRMTGPGEALAASIAVLFFGMVFTIPLGLLFSTLFAPLLALTQRHTRDRSIEAFELTLRVCGLWLAGVGLPTALVARLLPEATQLPPWIAPMLTWTTLGLTGLGLCCALVGQLGLIARRRWIRRIEAGTEPRWAVVELDAEAPGLAQLRPLFSSTAAPLRVLARRSAGVERGAYRTGDELEPFALL